MVELAAERNPLSASAGNGIVLGAFVRSVGSCVEAPGRQADAHRTIEYDARQELRESVSPIR